ncbi:hypothetical protein [Paenibacillus silvisoli]|uniref:hypothetical protein n=1 Tax=Paenibacillus silvisoli TaxID=3110539 RepID=UPI002803B9AE|nr:hypothetical protein [Paenibacillus silvisoli]
MIKRVGAIAVLLLVFSSIAIGCTKAAEDSNSAVAGDRLYIAEGYKQQLEAMKLTEDVALPYFHSPFIVVAHDRAGKQSAVIFPEHGEARTVKLEVGYDEIIRIIAMKGFAVNEPPNRENVHLFEIGGSLFWSYNDGSGQIYLDSGDERLRIRSANKKRGCEALKYALQPFFAMHDLVPRQLNSGYLKGAAPSKIK